MIRAITGISAVILAGLTLASIDARSRGLLINTLWLVGGALAISVPMGTFLGVVLTRSNVWSRRLAMLLLGGLLLIPLYLQAAAWQAGFGLEGWQTWTQVRAIRAPWLDGWRGAVWVHGCAGVPWVALFVGIAARRTPRELEESALLDLSLATVLMRVTLRLLLPAVSFAALWVAITAMTEMSVTDLFAVRTYAEELYIDLNAGSWNVSLDAETAGQGPVRAFPGIVLSAVAAIGFIIAAARLLTVPAGTRIGPPVLFSLGRLRGFVSLSVWLLVVLVVVLPLGNLIYKAGTTVEPTAEGFRRMWSPWKAIMLTAASPRDHATELMASASCVAGTVFLTLAVAAPLAYASGRSWIAAGLAALLAIAGLSVPGPLLGLGLISIFNDPAWPWLNYLYDHTIVVMVLGYSLRALPIAFFLTWHACQSIPQAQIDASRLDGVGPLRGMWLAVRQRPGAFALAGFAAAIVSLGELSATILVCPPGMEPLSVRLFGLLHFNVEDQVAAITLVLIAVHAAAAWALIGIGRRVFRLG